MTRVEDELDSFEVCIPEMDLAFFFAEKNMTLKQKRVHENTECARMELLNH